MAIKEKLNIEKFGKIQYLNFNPEEVLTYKLPPIIDKFKNRCNHFNQILKIYHLQKGIDLIYFDFTTEESFKICDHQFSYPLSILYNFNTKKDDLKISLKSHQPFKFNRTDIEFKKDTTYKFAIINFNLDSIESIFEESFTNAEMLNRLMDHGHENSGLLFIDETYSNVGNELLDIFFDTKPIKNDILPIFYSFKVYDVIYKTILLCLSFNQNLSEKIKFSSNDIHRIEKAKDLLIQDLEDSPTIPELAKLVSLNSSKLKHGFKSIYQNTIYGYLRDYRLRIAHDMIMKSGSSITEAATSIGYTSLSKFTVAFRKKYGKNPSSLLKIRNNTAIRKVS